MSVTFPPWPVYGHEWAVEQLRRAILNERVRHAYLFTGTESIGKGALARAFAQALNCTAEPATARPCGECRACRLIAADHHPDLLYGELDPGSGALRIEEVRSIMARTALKPYEARYRVAILRDFDRARPQAQDALLKTLEEPPPHALFVLLAPATEALLPTIISRSQVLALRPPSAETITAALRAHGADDERAALLAALSNGRIGWALRALADEQILAQRGGALDLLEQALAMNRGERFSLAEDLAKEKTALAALLELWQTYWRDLLRLCAGAPEPPANRDRAEALAALALRVTVEEAVVALQATRDLMSKLSSNMNLRLALEVMFLAYPGLRR